ncbi:MAG: GNAT family N-acetyltransferase [Proteobacteria bacterium]|nr:GNAT family N-acetyltransferase [Pseudomonadota bacterium]
MLDHLKSETPRCRIRPAVVGDLTALERAVGSPEFPQALPLARLHREGKLSHWLERLCTYDVAPKLWSITMRSSPECIGQVALVPELKLGTYWLSYWLTPAYWGRGIAKECIAALLRQSAAMPNYQVVVAVVAESNPRSISVLRGLGFKQAVAMITQSPIPDGHICFALEFGPENAV